MRRQLTIAAAALATTVVLAFLVPLGVLVRDVAEDRAVDEAERVAASLVPVVATVTERAELERVVAAADASSEGTVSVFLADGSVLGADAPDDAVARARAGRAFEAAAEGGRQLLVPVVAGAEVDVIRVLVPDGELRRGVATAWAILGGLGVALVVVAVVVADRFARLAVEPVRRLAEVAGRLGRGDLDARVEPAGPPEIRDVGHTLNALAGDVSRLLAAEREAVADLSHRLRTPVAALRLDAEAVRDPDLAERLQGDVDQLARAVDRLITEARRPARRALARSDLTAVTAERVAFWSALAEDQGRRYELTVPPGVCEVAVDPEELAAVVDALLQNVLSHTPEGCGFSVSVAPGASGGGRLVVEDEGPGIPDPSVVARGASGGGSTGLGLDIVRRAAEASGGSAAVGHRPGGGARVTVDLGPP